MLFKWIAVVSMLFLARASLAADPATVSQQYRLGTGDVISVAVFDEKELSLDKIRIGDVGVVSYPMLGDIQVKGLTVLELQQRVMAGLKAYLINPHVTVSVDQYRDFFINGQVNKPGNYPYQPGLTVRKAVSIAGGFKDRADKDTVSIVRETHDKLAPTKGNQSTLLEPGDIVTVEESFF